MTDHIRKLAETAERAIEISDNQNYQAALNAAIIAAAFKRLQIARRTTVT